MVVGSGWAAKRRFAAHSRVVGNKNNAANRHRLASATILCTLDSDSAALQSRLVKARQIKQGRAQELLAGRIRLVSPAILNQRVPA